MQYTIIMRLKNRVGARLAQASSAIQALAIIEALQTPDEEISSIRSRQEGDIGLEMLRVLAKEEEQELAG